MVARGLRSRGNVWWNPAVPRIYMDALRAEEGVLAEGGPLVVDTGVHTGRSPKDKFVVREPSSEGRIWWGKVNQPLEQEHYDVLREKVVAHLGPATLRDRRLRRRRPRAPPGAPRRHRPRLPRALRAHDVHHADGRGARGLEPEVVVLHAPGLEADPGRRRHAQRTFIVLHPARARC